MGTEPTKSRRESSPPGPCAKAKLVRGEPIVSGVLEAARQEIARVGYRALRIDDVATRAGVNKTTVYRRWASKPELVRDALTVIADEKFALPETGALRSDLMELGRNMVSLCCSSEGRSVMRMLFAEGADPEVVDLMKSLREGHEAMPRAMIASAVARGELAPDVDHMVLMDAFIGALHHKIFMMSEAANDAFVAQLVDLLLFGATPVAARAGVKKGAAASKAATR